MHRIKRIRWFFRLSLGVMLFCSSTAGAGGEERIQTVLIVSIDGLHPSALGPDTSPNLYALMAKGTFTLEGKSTSPPLTLLSHSAMFSGKGPDTGGMKINTWKPGQERIPFETIFNPAKANGFATGFFYAKRKLGYLVSPAIDTHVLDKEFSIEHGLSFFKESGRKGFCFIHVSGLDRTGPVEGWLSPEYMEELSYIDQSLTPLIRLVMIKKNYLIVVTSDHAGHGIIHGSTHPDDEKLPLILVSDRADLERYQGMPYRVTRLKSLLDEILGF